MKLISIITLPSIFAANTLEVQFRNRITGSNVLGTHGCHCSANAGLNRRLGPPVDRTDKACKDWSVARRCLYLEGGPCDGYDDDTTYDDSSQCSTITDNCAKELCRVDDTFASLINGLYDGTTAESCIVEDNSSDSSSSTSGTTRERKCCGAEGNYKIYNPVMQLCTAGEVADLDTAPTTIQNKVFLNPNGLKEIWVYDYIPETTGFSFVKKLESGAADTLTWGQGKPIVHQGNGKVYSFTDSSDNTRIPYFDYESGAYEGEITLEQGYHKMDMAIWTPEYGVLVFHRDGLVENPVPNPGQTAITDIADIPTDAQQFYQPGCVYKDGKVYLLSARKSFFLILDLSTKQWTPIHINFSAYKMWTYLLVWNDKFIHVSDQHIIIFKVNEDGDRINVLYSVNISRALGWCKASTCFPIMEGDDLYFWLKERNTGMHYTFTLNAAGDGVTSVRTDWSTADIYDYARYAHDNAIDNFKYTWSTVVRD